MLKRKSYRNGCLNDCQGKNIYKNMLRLTFTSVLESERSPENGTPKTFLIRSSFKTIT